jgi:hypothetical protein
MRDDRRRNSDFVTWEASFPADMSYKQAEPVISRPLAAPPMFFFLRLSYFWVLIGNIEGNIEPRMGE